MVQFHAAMAYKVRKTEKAGAKHGKGALWRTKQEAKHESSQIRRRNARIEVVRQLELYKEERELK